MSNATDAHRITIEDTGERVTILFRGVVIADTTQGKVMREGSLPAVYYIPESGFVREHLTPSDHRTHCPFKGTASYYHIVVGEHTVENAAWYYADPIEAVSSIENHAAFYPDRVDEIRVEPR